MNNENDRKEFFDNLEKVSKVFNETVDHIEKDQEDYWNSLSKQDQLKAFCAVVRRIHQGEVQEQHSYRGMLYSVFGFGPEAYVQAQVAGYLTIHNMLFDARELENNNLTNNPD